MTELIAFLKSNAGEINAFGAVASATAAFLALIVSALSVWISVQTMKSQQKHNKLSVRPLAEVTVADYENSLRVKLRNNGTGPMIITNIDVSKGANHKRCLVDWMPQVLPNRRIWTNYSSELRDRSLQPGSEIVLLELTECEGEDDFGTCRDKVRAALAPLTVTVCYTDIYKDPMPIRVKSLSWFGRHER